ncbi:unnamed protein product [Alopecurus aequalis]
MEMELHADGDAARRRFHDYLLALEEERRKIHVFQRELPLCLDLVTQTIEGIRSQMDAVASEEETVTDQGPVLEEFIPLKPASLSLCSSDDETSHAVPPVDNKDDGARPPTPETKTPMPDWLQSVQLWSQQSSHTKDLPCKPVALNATKAGGAFHPFEKNKPAQAEAEVPASSTTISAVVGDSGDKPTSDTADELQEKHDKVDMEKDKDDKQGQSQPSRKPRRCWAPELHRLFLQALQQLGGPHVATPKQIRELMKVDGLTNDEVKSHLQKYRLHTSRRPSSTVQSSSAAGARQPGPQFVVVGSCFWVPQQEYAQPQVKLTNVPSGSTSQVYAPVATLPSGLQPRSEKQSSERRRSSNNGDASSDSPAVSSSSQTNSA